MESWKETIKRVVARLRAHPAYVTLAGLGFLGALDVVGHVQSGISVVESVAGKPWTALLMNPTAVRLLGFALLLGAFWRIGSLSAHAERDETMKRRAMIEAPLAYIRYFHESRQCYHAIERIGIIKTYFEIFAADIAAFRAELPLQNVSILRFFPDRDDPLGRCAATIKTELDDLGQQFGLSRDPDGLKTVAPVYEWVGTGLAETPKKHFPAAENVSYIFQHQQNLAYLEGLRSRLEQRINERQDSLALLAGRLENPPRTSE